jgi:hypothetical protein
MCIGMQRHNGVKVAYDNSLRQLLGKVNFSKTSADLCSIIIYTGELKIKRKFELGKNLKFSMKASDSTQKVTVELLLIGDNGKVMNAKYEISASEDWTDYKVCLNDFNTYGEKYEICRELKFLIYRDNVRNKKCKITLKNVVFE